MTQYRLAHDTMGEVKVPVDALWRAQTQRAVENFPISGRGLETAQIRALGLLKAACAQVNKDSGALDAEKADAIIAAAKEIAEGKHNEAFPIDVFQTGSGTSSNMNTNEVIASIAHNNGVEIHPNDHVNMGQSSNDTFPTATHVAATEAAVNDLIPGLKVLHESLTKKAKEFADVVKAGRTHLMDATPVTLGQEQHEQHEQRATQHDGHVGGGDARDRPDEDVLQAARVPGCPRDTNAGPGACE